VNLGYLLEQNENISTLIVLLLVGSLICFSGYRFVYIVLGMCGLLSGFTSALLVIGAMSNLSIEWIIIIASVFGIIGLLVSIFLFKLGIFILGVIGGISLSIVLTPIMDAPIVVVLFSMLGGIFALILEKPVIIFSTASIGSMLIFLAVLHIIELLDWVRITSDFDPKYFHLISGLVWLGLTVLGSAIQFRYAYSK